MSSLTVQLKGVDSVFEGCGVHVLHPNREAMSTAESWLWYSSKNFVTDRSHVDLDCSPIGSLTLVCPVQTHECFIDQCSMFFPFSIFICLVCTWHTVFPERLLWQKRWSSSSTLTATPLYPTSFHSLTHTHTHTQTHTDTDSTPRAVNAHYRQLTEHTPHLLCSSWKHWFIFSLGLHLKTLHSQAQPSNLSDGRNRFLGWLASILQWENRKHLAMEVLDCKSRLCRFEHSCTLNKTVCEMNVYNDILIIVRCSAALQCNCYPCTSKQHLYRC